MRLIILYGQEATGKLSIAKSLVNQTELKLFHNHVSIDVAKTLYDYGNSDYDELVFKVRLLVFESAAKSQIPGLIFTWAYTHPQCYSQLETIQQTLKKYNVIIDLVFVSCTQQELEDRVSSPERKYAGKINTVEKLHRQQKRKNCIEIPNSNSLVLDNTELSPDEAASIIVRELELSVVSA